MGPAQLTWATARTLGVDDPFAPAETTDAGARYLASLLARYRGDTHLAVAAYNAGPHAVTDCIPQNGETELYVPRVLALHARLRGLTRREATRSRR
jgi:soluble lytic murein transglycosylase-like protein